MSHKYQSPHFENMQQRKKFIYVNAFLQDASQKEQNTILSKIYTVLKIMTYYMTDFIWQGNPSTWMLAQMHVCTQLCMHRQMGNPKA